MMDADITHVITWLPPRFIQGRMPGYWELRTIAAWNLPVVGEPFADYDADRDATWLDLKRWAAGVIGCPVYLTAGEQELPRSFGRWSAEPLFFVRRAA